MNSGSRRSLIAPTLFDLSVWRTPDEEAIDPTKLLEYQRRKRAVKMYAAGQPYSVIEESVSLSRQEVRRLVRRCVATGPDGAMAGFTALVPGHRIKCYVRTAAVNHAVGGSSGGCAGALTMLFDHMPEVRAHVEDQYLKRIGRGVPNARISYRELHGEFLAKLQEAGLGSNDWPFNTKDEGYKSLRQYCHDLLAKEPGRWFGARAGAEAARRSGVGSGYSSILPIMRGMTTCQLDFHKVDAASVIMLETGEGECLPVPVARWHLGILAEERWGLILGAWIALELNPSGDSVLEVMEAALRPMDSNRDGAFCVLTIDGKVFPNQVMPDLAYQGFSVLKMDNAWSNAASEVVDNIIRTVGCAVNFGPVRAWWRRTVVERIFGQLTRRGLQRLPSTLGNGPKDPVRDDPVGQAKKFQITIKDLTDIIHACIREHNETRSEGIGFASPMSALTNALNQTSSGVFLQPLPCASQTHLKLLMHTEIVTVRGNLQKHVRPYVNVGRWKYTSPELAASYHLIGRKLILYCDRRDVQVVHATVFDSGELLGALNAPRKWSHLRISWRERSAMNNAGLYLRQHETGLSPVTQWRERKTLELKAGRKRTKKDLPTPTAALAIARNVAAEERRDEQPVRVPNEGAPVAPMQMPRWLIAGLREDDIGSEVLYGD